MWLALSCSGFALAVLLHAISVRTRSNPSIARNFVYISSSIAILLACIAFWRFAITDESIAAILIYVALSEAYLFLITLAATGVSVSLLMRLSSRPMAEDDLMRSYSTRAMVERRLDQLQAGGFLVEAGGRLRLRERGKALVRAFVIARSLFKHRRSFDVVGPVHDRESGEFSRWR